MINDGARATGKVKLTFKRENGSVEVYEYKNLITTVGRNHRADQMSDQGEAAMSHMAIGEGAAAAVLGDTVLGSEVASTGRQALTSVTQSTNTVIYVGDWAAGQGTGTITEAGIFNNATIDTGTLLSRTVFTAKAKGAGDTMSIQWTITFA